MADKKPGFFKRLFKFGKKKDVEKEVETVEPVPAGPSQEEPNQQAESERAAAEAEQRAKQEVEAIAAREEEVRRLATAAEAKRVADEAARAEQVRFEAEKQAAEQLAREKAEAEGLKAEKEAKLAAEKAAAKEQERKATEERAAKEAAERKAAEEAEAVRLERENQDREARERAQQKAIQEAARLKAEAEKARQQANEGRLVKEKVEREKQAAENKRQVEERQKAEAEQRESERDRREEEKRLARERARQEAAEAEAKRLAEEQAERERAEAEAKRLAAEKEAAVVEEKRLAEELAEAERKASAEEAQRFKEERLAQEPTAYEAEIVAAGEPPPVAPPTDKEPKKKTSWFNRLKGGLSRSSTQLSESITGVFTKKKLDDDTLQELEDILIRADLGVETAMSITDKLAAQRMGKDVSSEEVRGIMADEIEAVLEPVAAELELDLDHQPHVILVVGVNGSGKTTTIGKLSQKLYDAGFSTLLVAGDTFRAAAIEQLKIWGDRTQSPVLSRPLGADAAGLAFDAYEQAKDEGRDVMLMDTAGRLQNRTELMDELAKIVRVLKKQDPEAPHTVLLTLDATTGQNALNQVEIFRDIAGVNGLVMTKLDGTARGGILVAISARYKLPVFFLGVGEQVDDLEPFEARDFARSIAGLV